MQLFCDAKREEIKAANPGVGFGETGKLLAAAWKECSPEDKANFQEQSQVRNAPQHQACESLHGLCKLGRTVWQTYPAHPKPLPSKASTRSHTMQFLSGEIRLALHLLGLILSWRMLIVDYHNRFSHLLQTACSCRISSCNATFARNPPLHTLMCYPVRPLPPPCTLSDALPCLCP